MNKLTWVQQLWLCSLDLTFPKLGKVVALYNPSLSLVSTHTGPGGRKHRKKKRKAKKKEPEEEEVEGEISMEGETTSTHLSEGKCYVTAASTLKIEIAICTGHGASSSGHIRNLPALPDELQQPTVAGEEQEHAMGVGGREIFRHELSCPNGEHC